MDGYEVPINYRQRYENVRFGQSGSDRSSHPPAVPLDRSGTVVNEEEGKHCGLRKFTIVVGSTLCLIFIALLTLSILLAREINNGNELRSKIQEIQRSSLTHMASQLNESEFKYLSKAGPLSRNLEDLRAKRLLDARLFRKTINNLNISMQEVRSDAVKLNYSIGIVKQNIATLISGRESCPMWYANKCFFPYNTTSDYASAKEICMERDGDLANIYGSAQMYMLMNYIRQNMMNEISVLNFHIGMTIVPSTGIVTLSNGQQAPYLKWDDAYPSTSSSHTWLLLRVNTSPSSTDQYLWNAVPCINCYFICEI